MKTILSINNLVVGYDKFFPVLKNISFEITEGEFVGIIGPNGSGKTTLLKTISRILNIFEGGIILFDKNIYDYDLISYAQNVSFATKITDYSLKYSVKEFLFLGRFPFYKTMKYKVWSMQEVIQISEQFEIKHLWDKKLDELSSGELQRVIVAQSLVQTPKLLLLDEPTSHLDISHQVAIMDFVKKINTEQRMTILASFHDLNFVSEYCDKIILLDNGKIKKIGTCFDVLDYKILEEVYKTTVVVKNNPISGKPYVLPVPMMWEKNRNM